MQSCIQGHAAVQDSRCDGYAAKELDRTGLDGMEEKEALQQLAVYWRTTEASKEKIRAV